MSIVNSLGVRLFCDSQIDNIVTSSREITSEILDTQQWHSACFQVPLSTRQSNPVEIPSYAVQECVPAWTNPPSALRRYSTAVAVSRIVPGLVVTVVGWEHVTAAVTKHVRNVAGELSQLQNIVTGFVANDKLVILDWEPFFRQLLLQVNFQLVTSVLGQSMYFVVTQPEVTITAAKPLFELWPRTVKEGGLVDFLLHEDRCAIS